MHAAGLEHRALTDDRLGHLSVEHLARGQVTGAGVDRELLVVEREGRVGLIGERQVGFVEGADGADVLPVVVEQEALQVIAAIERLGDDFLAEIGGRGVLGQQIEQGVTAEHINAHRGQVRPLEGFIRGKPKP